MPAVSRSGHGEGKVNGVWWMSEDRWLEYFAPMLVVFACVVQAEHAWEKYNGRSLQGYHVLENFFIANLHRPVLNNPVYSDHGVLLPAFKFPAWCSCSCPMRDHKLRSAGLYLKPFVYYSITYLEIKGGKCTWPHTHEQPEKDTSIDDTLLHQ